MKYTYYCPRGCEVFHAEDEGYTECMNCGSRMTPDQDAFEDAVERREIERTAEILEDATGFYISAEFPDGSRDRLSFEYWHTRKAAEHALRYRKWSERDYDSPEWEWGD